MNDYVDLILCVMEVESHGEGLDPMQAAEVPLIRNIPKSRMAYRTHIIQSIAVYKNCMQFL